MWSGRRHRHCGLQHAQLWYRLPRAKVFGYYSPAVYVDTWQDEQSAVSTALALSLAERPSARHPDRVLITTTTTIATTTTPCAPPVQLLRQLYNVDRVMPELPEAVRRWRRAVGWTAPQLVYVLQ